MTIKTRPAPLFRGFIWLLIVSTLSSLFPTRSDAAFDRTVSWAVSSDLEQKSISRSQYDSSRNLYQSAVVSEKLMDHVLRDRDGRISKDFHIPSGLKAAVTFWFRIYTEYSTQKVVVFDSNHLDLVYEVIDLSKIAEASNNQLDYDTTAGRLVQTVINKYRNAFYLLSKTKKPKNPSREETIILAKIKSLPRRHSMSDLAKNLKVIKGQRDNIIKGLLAAETYLPKMELIFARMKIPTELTRLSLVESSFNLKALSKAGALGVWQFMPASGKSYLFIDPANEIDERLSPLKATLAAGKLLLWNYKYLGNWPLAIISYNHGAKNLPRLSGEKYKFSKIANLFTVCGVKNPALGWASRNYYSEFLAALYAESYRTLLFGETPVPTIRPVMFRQLVRRQTGLSIALEKGISLQEFRLFNADIQDLQRLLPEGFWIAIPGQKDDIAELVEHVLDVTVSDRERNRSYKRS